jgi:hypothetical protein
MLAPNTKSTSNRSTKLIPAPIRRTRLLLASDSMERMQSLRAAFDQPEFDITCVDSFGDLLRVCWEPYDVVVLDVRPDQLTAMLAAIRMSEGNASAAILVEASRLTYDPDLVGVLPRYRAMPCSQAEMLNLLRAPGEKGAASQRGML